MKELSADPKVLSGEIVELEKFITELKARDPEQYMEKKEELTERLKNLRVAHFKIVIKVYPKRNPLKYNTVDNEGISKKEAMAAKLIYLEGGGDPIHWDYPKWRRANEGTPEPTVEIPCSAEKCDFKAKNANGLTIHVKAKHTVGPVVDSAVEPVATPTTDVTVEPTK